MIDTSWVDDMDKEIEASVRALIKIPELDVRAHKDPASMSYVVSAELDSRIVSAVSDKVIARLGNVVGMGVAEFQQFLRFLSNDPEMRDRFTAYKTAKRLMGDK